MQSRARFDLVRAVRDADRDEGLFADDQIVVVGVSGGADSVALLVALARYAGERGVRLHVAHLDHGLRAESAADAAFVAGLARRLGLPATIEVRDVSAASAALRRGTEHAARVVRYRFLAEVAARLGAPVVAVGHTADDVAETVLMHLIRGSGPTGLGAMPAAAPLPEATGGPARLRLVRPLVRCWRADVRAFAAAEGFEWREDASNLDLRFQRNRVRLRWLPLLEAENPRLREALVRLARASADDEEWLDELVAHEWSRVAVRVDDQSAGSGAERAGGSVCEHPPTPQGEVPSASAGERTAALHLSAWRACRPALRRRLLRAAWSSASGDSGDLEWVHVRAVSDLARRGHHGSRVHLPRGLEAVCLGDRLVLRGRAEAASGSDASGGQASERAERCEAPAEARGAATGDASASDEARLAPGGSLGLACGWVIEACECSPRGAEPAEGSPDAPGTVSRAAWAAAPGAPSGAEPARGPWTALVDADRLRLQEGALGVRSRRPGDRMAPAGMGGRHRSLQDVFVDGKVPRQRRGAWPVVVDGDGIVWLPGYRVDERVIAGPGCRRAWRLTARPPEGWRAVGAGGGAPSPASQAPR